MYLPSNRLLLLAMTTLPYIITSVAQHVTRGKPISRVFNRAAMLSVHFWAGGLVIYYELWPIAILWPVIISYQASKQMRNLLRRIFRRQQPSTNSSN